jgi:uncharacterized damage-inducible protein DinB
MTWTVPETARVPEPFVADERTMLDGWLDWHRATLVWKCAWLAGEQLADQSVTPSNLSLLGLVRHMAEVERSWFRSRFAGEAVTPIYTREDAPDADIEEGDPEWAEQDFARLAEEQAASRRAVAGASLDDTFEHPRHGTMSLRWIYGHMIEEYARHNGHADLLRERIDGVTGS